ncbi:5'-3' exonuclease H3TH domain-containing protein [Schlesneria sp. DSM 10557]|uniref:5'-3' exonuclease n=1 Tax=Schlesneria sp. DSM 10557 TaxID=3044399 RepID=UPI00359FA17E
MRQSDAVAIGRTERRPGELRIGVGSDESTPPQQYGLVVIVDLLNLLVKAFHAGPPSRINGVRSMLSTVANVIEKLSPEYLIFAADGGHVARSAAFADYKAHRPPKPVELIEQIALAESAIEAIGWPLIRVTDWEADDVIASLATAIVPTSAGVVVCSCDKDLLQLCTEGQRIKIYHPWDGGKFLGGSYVEEKYGITRNQLADYLALVGDASDGVPGVKGIGPNKAGELLGKHHDLESILEAGRCLLVPGAVGKALREQADAARLSRRLVELHRGLVIPTAWHDFPAVSPRAGWIEALRSMDLGQAANRLSEILPLTGCVRTGTSKIEVTHEQPDLWPAGTVSSSGSVAAATAQETTESIGNDLQRPLAESDGGAGAPTLEAVPQSGGVLGVPVGTPAARLWNATRYIPHEERTRDAVDDAMTRDYRDADWWRHYPLPAVLPPDCEQWITLRSTYATARTEIERRGPLSENSWKAGTVYHYVTELAMGGKEFSLPCDQTRAEPVARQLQSSLF